MVRMAFSSISRCSASIVGSMAMTRSPSSTSRSTRACTASAIWRSASPPISATLRVISCKSVSNALVVWSIRVVVTSVIVLYLGIYRHLGIYRRLPEPAGDVVLRARVLRRGEHFARRIEFDQLAEIHEGSEFRHPRGLLHVVGDDHNRIVVGQLVD